MLKGEKMKRIIYIILCITMIVNLSGCGFESNTTTEEAATEVTVKGDSQDGVKSLEKAGSSGSVGIRPANARKC